jgi:hypothetical protein
MSALAGCALAAAVGWTAAPAGATSPPCTSAPCMVSFAMTGAVQSWTVPTGVDHITAAVAAGNGGGSSNTPLGGLGGAVTATVPVTAGDALSIVVGAAGANGTFGQQNAPSPAYGGGGLGFFEPGGGMGFSEGSGGGGSFVFDTTANDALLVAAGGGGGTSGNATGGGNGGAGGPGDDGSTFCGQTPSGGGGTLSAGGAGGGNAAVGAAGTGPATSATSLGVGGDTAANAAGAGGGGGYYGGGGGGASTGNNCGVDGSGGGGSGFLDASASNVQTSTNTGDGSVQITYQAVVSTPSPSPSSSHTSTPSASPTTSSSAPASSSAGASGAVELAKSTVSQGGQDTATGSGFTPGERVSATLHSTAIALGTFTASRAGVVRFTFTIPAGLAAGAHHVVLVGATSGVRVSARLTVIAAPASANPLPDTGVPTGGLAVLALALLVGGIGVLALGRRRLPWTRHQH